MLYSSLPRQQGVNERGEFSNHKLMYHKNDFENHFKVEKLHRVSLNLNLTCPIFTVMSRGAIQKRLFLKILIFLSELRSYKTQRHIVFI